MSEVHNCDKGILNEAVKLACCSETTSGRREPETLERGPEGFTEDEIRAEIRALNREAYRLNPERQRQYNARYLRRRAIARLEDRRGPGDQTAAPHQAPQNCPFSEEEIQAEVRAIKRENKRAHDRRAAIKRLQARAEGGRSNE